MTEIGENTLLICGKFEPVRGIHPLGRAASLLLGASQPECSSSGYRGFRQMPRSLLMVIAPGLLLAGCLSKPVDPQVAASPFFQQGYADGCATSAARSRAYDQTKTRDDKAYAEDDFYRRGWNNGFRECGSPMTQKDPAAEPSVDWKKSGPLN